MKEEEIIRIIKSHIEFHSWCDDSPEEKAIDILNVEIEPDITLNDIIKFYYSNYEHEKIINELQLDNTELENIVKYLQRQIGDSNEIIDKSSDAGILIRLKISNNQLLEDNEKLIEETRKQQLYIKEIELDNQQLRQIITEHVKKSYPLEDYTLLIKLKQKEERIKKCEQYILKIKESKKKIKKILKEMEL